MSSYILLSLYQIPPYCFLHSQICRKISHSVFPILVLVLTFIEEIRPQVLCSALGRADCTLGLLPSSSPAASLANIFFAVLLHFLFSQIPPC